MNTKNNVLRVDTYRAGNIEAGETYGYVSQAGSMASTILITSVQNGVAQAICSHHDESWIVSFDSKTGAGIRDFVGAQLVVLI